MDLTKFFLYTALAIVTYLMLLAWQEDYPPLVDDGSVATSTALPEAPPLADTPLNIPDDVAQQNSAPAAAAQPPQTQVSATSATERTIIVVTDTLQLTISLDGGDIIALSLPLYLKQLEEDSDPFEILEFDPGRQYVAQSGLIGRDGIDSNGRAQYQASASEFRLADGAERLQVDLVHQTETGVRVTKRYVFNRDSYLIDVSFVIDNQSSASFQANPFG
ncbi:MAG: membrane protein insertase YidC, partial [Gammaproteobacteria bacterium]